MIAGAVKFVFWFYDAIQQHRSASTGTHIPKETLRVAAIHPDRSWWHTVAIGVDPSYAGSDRVLRYQRVNPVRILQIDLRYGFMGRKQANAAIIAA